MRHSWINYLFYHSKKDWKLQKNRNDCEFRVSCRICAYLFAISYRSNALCDDHSYRRPRVYDVSASSSQLSDRLLTLLSDRWSCHNRSSKWKLARAGFSLRSYTHSCYRVRQLSKNLHLLRNSYMYGRFRGCTVSIYGFQIQKNQIRTKGRVWAKWVAIK